MLERFWCQHSAKWMMIISAVILKPSVLVEWKKANTSSNKAEYPSEVNLVESIVWMASYFSVANRDTLMLPWCFKWWVQMTEFVQSSQRFPPGMTAHWRQTTHCLCTYVVLVVVNLDASHSFLELLCVHFRANIQDVYLLSLCSFDPDLSLVARHTLSWMRK